MRHAGYGRAARLLEEHFSKNQLPFKYYMRK